jgi:predicted membrane protein
MELLHFLGYLLGNNEFSLLAQNVGLAFLTIFIPVAIAIFGDEKKDFRQLDSYSILDHVIAAKKLLFCLALVFIPVLFWQTSSFSLRLLEVSLWLIGICYLVGRLFVSYKWIKGNKFPLRFEYLRKLNNPNDMEEVWSSVWSSENINPQNEKEFFEIFSEKIDELT